MSVRTVVGPGSGRKGCGVQGRCGVRAGGRKWTNRHWSARLHLAQLSAPLLRLPAFFLAKYSSEVHGELGAGQDLGAGLAMEKWDGNSSREGAQRWGSGNGGVRNPFRLVFFK